MTFLKDLCAEINDRYWKRHEAVFVDFDNEKAAADHRLCQGASKVTILAHPAYARRQLPLASDRDRIAAARYAAEKLAIRLAIIARRRRLLWEHYSDSNGAVVSTNA